MLIRMLSELSWFAITLINYELYVDLLTLDFYQLIFLFPGHYLLEYEESFDGMPAYTQI